jgi:hypothetical protein
MFVTNQKYKLTFKPPAGQSMQVRLKFDDLLFTVLNTESQATVQSRVDALPGINEAINTNGDATVIAGPNRTITVTKDAANTFSFEFLDAFAGYPQVMTAEQLVYGGAKYGTYKFEESQKAGLNRVSTLSADDVSGFAPAGVNISDISSSNVANPLRPYGSSYEVVMDDDVEMPDISRAISVNVDGSVHVLMSDGKETTLVLVAGVIYPFAIKKVFSSGTTVTKVFAFN